MIDIENKIVDLIQTAYTSAGKTVDVTSEYVDMPETFPTVMVRQTSQEDYQRTQDNSADPHHVRVTIRIDVFSNKKKGAKSDVKALAGIAINAMHNLKFTQTSASVDSSYDRTIAKATMRFTAIVGEGVKVGTTTTYQIYR